MEAMVIIIIAIVIIVIWRAKQKKSNQDGIVTPISHYDYAGLLSEAERGDVNAQSRLAYMYAVGEDVKKDEDKAFYWYNKAAMQGHVYSKYELAKMYNSAFGKFHNIDSAERTLIEIVNIDDWVGRYAGPSALALGRIYQKQEKLDYSSALYWLYRAKLIDTFESGTALSDIEDEMERISRTSGFVMSEVIKSQWNSDYFMHFLKKAESGDMDSQYEIATQYRRGRLIEKDDDKALYWFSASAKQGNIASMSSLVTSYYFDYYVPNVDPKLPPISDKYRNLDLAEEWLLKVIELSDEREAGRNAVKLSELYMEKQNYLKAIYWLYQAQALEDMDYIFKINTILAENGLSITNEQKRQWEDEARQRVYSKIH